MKRPEEVFTMKVFMGYHCTHCDTDFDTDSRNLIDHTEPDCPICECNQEVKHIYVDDAEEE